MVTTLILGLDRNLPGDDHAVVHASRLLHPIDAVHQVDDGIIDRGMGSRNKTGNREFADNNQQILSLPVHHTRPIVEDLAKALEQRWTVQI